MATSSSSSLSSTTKIGKGRFEVTEDESHKLGQGSYGTVYKAKDLENDGRPVAAKKSVIYSEFIADPDVNWRHEAEMLSRIRQHENVVERYLLDTVVFVNEKGIPMTAIWLITEYCDKGNLQDYAYITDLSLHDKLDILLQSGQGVDHLHQENVVHRDLKPQNILISGSAPNVVVKLCDFGEARDIVKVNDQSVMMKTVKAFGTRTYMAPEQTAQQDGKFVYKRNVDVFAFGVTGITLLNAQKRKLMKSPTGNYLLLIYTPMVVVINNNSKKTSHFILSSQLTTASSCLGLYPFESEMETPSTCNRHLTFDVAAVASFLHGCSTA